MTHPSELSVEGLVETIIAELEKVRKEEYWSDDTRDEMQEHVRSHTFLRAKDIVRHVAALRKIGAKP